MVASEQALTGATNILLEEPPIAGGREACTTLLVDESTDHDVLFVSYTRQATDCVGQVADEPVGGLGVITVGDADPEVDDESVSTDRITTPSDLTGLGIKIDEFLSTREGPVYVCFDSVTTALQYVDYQTVYKFVHAMTGKIHAADAQAHFHIDPSAHTDEQVAGLTALFDARVSTAGGERTVTRRKLVG